MTRNSYFKRWCAIINLITKAIKEYKWIRVETLKKRERALWNKWVNK